MKAMNQVILTDPTTIFQTLENCPDGTTIRFQPLGKTVHVDASGFQWLEKNYYISNNRHGLKRVAFPIIGKKNVTFDGGGACFIFHGEIMPFVVEDSENIVLKNFTVDWERPFYSQGTVVEADESGVLLEIDRGRYPYRIEGEEIIFEGEGWESGFTEGVFEFDVQTRAPAYRSGDSMGLGFPDRIRVEDAGDGLVRLAEKFPHLPTIGNVIVLRHYRRHCPGIHLLRSRDVLLGNIILHHAGGMGVIAQFCEDVTVRKCQVTPSGDRLFSVTVDATHFVNCKGMVRLEDCLFEGQLDDPTNVHGINTRISELLDEYSVMVELVHHEQHGVEIAFPGDHMRIADNTSLLPVAENEVLLVERIDERYSKVVFNHPLPATVESGHVLENLSWTPDLHIRGCTARNNRARGFLISTPGRVVVENNHIESSGAGIKISGDANYWFESGAVRDVLIRNNDFGDCCYGCLVWGRAVIDIDPEISKPWKMRECFHRNIRIENNRFSTFDSGILFARSVDGLVFRGNTIRRSDSYPPTGCMQEPIMIEACENVDVEEEIPV